MLRTIVLALVMITGGTIYAQDEVRNAKEEADHYFEKEGYFKATDLYKEAYSKAKTPEEKASLIYMVGECYRMMEDHPQAEVWYRRAIKSRHDDPKSWYYLAKSLQSQGRFDEAKEELVTYAEKGGDAAMADKVLTSIQFAETEADKKSRYEVDPVVMLNTEFYDFAPTLVDGKGDMLYFCSSRLGSTGVDEFKKTGESYQDMFMTTRDSKGKWSEPERLPLTVNGYDHEGASAVTSDGMRMYFTRCAKEGDGCAIYMTTKVDDKWGDSKEVKLSNGFEAPTVFGHPALTPDDQVMIFASDIPGGQGGKDLWYSVYNGTSNSWGAPVNLGPGINTAGHEMFPFVRSNGDLYFASTGLDGMGGLDNFVANKAGDNEWANPKNLGGPMNTNANDYGIIFEGDAERGYFTSDRAGGRGQDDIYSFSLPEVLMAFEGLVYDKKGQFPIEGAYVRVAGSDGSSFESVTDANGAFMFDQNGDARYILPEVNYDIEVGMKDYLVAKDRISTVGLGEESTTFVKEFLLQSTLGGEIEFPEVQYDLGKYTLREASKDSLNYLYQTLIDNPTIIIELGAHTDSRGGNGANQTLSQNRAKACVDYLISRGIPSARMKPKGYGENKLKISDAKINAAPSSEREALHQKNRRTVFSVLSWDYVPN